MEQQQYKSEQTAEGYQDLDERRRAALAEIDEAKFGWFHIRACLVAGVGFYTDAYDLFTISLVSTMLGFIYFGGTTPSDIDLGIKVAAPVGTLVGQLFFGWLADVLGRKKMYGVELMIIIVGTIGQCFSGTSPVLSLGASLMFWRIIVGLGIGGDYPLSAVITSEFATTGRRGAMMAAVFAMQGFGYLTTGIVSIITLAAAKSAIIASTNAEPLDYVWRIVIGFGAIPAVIAVYFRLTIPETPRYTMDVEQNIAQAARDVTVVLKPKNALEEEEFEVVPVVAQSKASLYDFFGYFSHWRNLKILLGTSVCWFCLDVAFYGIGLNNSIVLTAINFGSVSGVSYSLGAYDTVWNAAVGQLIITLLGAVPGYWCTVFLIEKMGRKLIQLMGFFICIILFAILGFGFTALQQHSVAAFIVFFTLVQFFMNFGPNSTTFIIPGEVFPTRYRSTGHGIAAASGKLGAIISQVGFSKLQNIGGKNAFVPHLLEIFGLFMIIGFFFTFLLPETKGKTLEELSNEPEYRVTPKEKKRHRADVA